MKKILSSLLLGVSFCAYANPTVKLKTSSLGVTTGMPFIVNATFSEDVSAFTSAGVSLKNGMATNFSGSKANYSIQVKAIQPGKMTVFIPSNTAVNCNAETNDPSNTLSINALNPGLNPSSNFDLSRFQLITPLPIGAIGGGAHDIESPQLNGNPSANTGYSNPPYFYTDPQTGAMVFFAPTGGATTPGSSFARCELAEEEDLQWMLTRPFINNLLTASLRIDQLPPNNIITIGQIHDRGDTDPFGNAVSNEPLLKVVYSGNSKAYGQSCGGCVYAEIRLTPATPSSQQLDYVIKTGIQPNALFTYSMQLTRNGKLTIKVEDKTFSLFLNTSNNNNIGWGSQNFLFHAGAYLHVQGTSTTEGGKVSFYYLNVKHTA